MERTLVLVKTDAMQRGLAGEILSRLERRGLRIVALRLFQMDDELAAAIAEALGERAVVVAEAASVRHAASLAELGYRRLADGEGQGPEALRVIYLRPAAIVPPKR